MMESGPVRNNLKESPSAAHCRTWGCLEVIRVQDLPCGEHVHVLPVGVQAAVDARLSVAFPALLRCLAGLRPGSLGCLLGSFVREPLPLGLLPCRQPSDQSIEVIHRTLPAGHVRGSPGPSSRGGGLPPGRAHAPDQGVSRRSTARRCG